jgi:dTMP kinase
VRDLSQLKTFFHPPQTPGSYFISLEGIEGSGKSTQIQFLQDYFKARGLRVLCLREPGGTLFGEKLREAILHSQTPLHPLAECYLFLASRAQLLNEKILPFLERPGSVVILDRYIDSTLVYQGKARGLGLETVLELHRLSPLCLMPHRTYFLDIDLATSHERQQLRAQKKDYFESQENPFYQSLIQGYREVAGLFPERIKRLDATVNAPQVSQLIQEDLAGLLP